MTPAAIIALVRDIGLVLGVGLILWFVYRGGQDHVKAADLKGLQNAIERQAETLRNWRQESTDANIQLSKDVAAINSAPPVQHVWVRESSCPAVLPATTTATSGQPASAGGVEPGLGDAATADRRDFAVAEFKRKWETEFAECRALAAQWPSP